MCSRVIKILIVGHENVGKASLINMYRNDTFSNIGPLSTYLDCKTNYGVISIQLTQSHTYENGHDADMIMFDLTRHDTLNITKNIPNSRKPRVLVGNKCDTPRSLHISCQIKFRQGYRCYDVSAKRGSSLDKPLLFLLRQLISPKLRFVN